MAGKSIKTATLFAQKKLLNKAQTSVLKSDAQEIIGSNIQPAAETTFGQKIPTSPTQTLYLMQSGSLGGPVTVEYVQFDIESISGTSYDANNEDSGAGPEPSTTGPHGYKLILTGNYQSLSSNPKKGNGIFDDGKVAYTTIGGLQLIPPVFSNDSPNPYTIKLYKGNPSDPTKEIPLESEIDWQLDTFNGILFVQDYDSSNVPLFARGFIYVGDMVDEVIQNTGGGGSGDNQAEYLVLSPTGSLQAERVFTPSTGLVATDAGAGGNYTLKIKDSVVATLTGSVFSGIVSAPALSGSLTKLQDGSSYLRAGSNITITSGSNGSISITGTSGGTDRSKDVYLMNSNVNAGSPISVSSSDFSTALFDPNKIDIFLNGQLVHSGSVSQVNAGSRDYYISSATSLRFSFKIVVDDILDVVVFSAS
jgi:hypothetical protein